MKICIFSLRNKIKYEKLMQNIGGMDCYALCLKYLVVNNPEHEFSYYNFSFDNNVPTEAKAVKDADVIIIPAVKEFLYFNGSIHGLYCKRTQEALGKLLKYLNKKCIIVLSLDTAVNKELLMEKSFENRVKPSSIHDINSNDFKLGLCGLRYHFIKRAMRQNKTLLEPDTSKIYDFVYWGSDKRKGVNGKSEDTRHEIIRDIQQSGKIKTYIVGRWPKTTKIEVDLKWSPMRDLAPVLKRGISTICWNWINQKAMTARYQEAIACGIFPFVWGDFDKDNRIIHSSFQRVHSIDEYFKKLKVIKMDFKYYKTVERHFLENLPSTLDYVKAFNRKVRAIIRKNT